MLPNHPPLVVAEAFGTLAELYPGRIDLGLGRAPGTDGATMRALRRDRVETEEDFPRDVAELQRLLGPADPNARISATPGSDTHIPIWLLGSSLYSAQLAAMKGLPYAFASHFAPRFLHQAIGLYRQLFRPSAVLDKPYVMVGVPVVAAPTDAEAQFLATSTQQRVLGILTGQRGKLPPPVEGFLQQQGPREQAAIQDFLALAVVGGPETVRQGFAQIQQSTEADELILVTDIHDPALRLRSLEISAQALAG
jgi:luciferase family oxidoreductase group 1